MSLVAFNLSLPIAKISQHTFSVLYNKFSIDKSIFFKSDLIVSSNWTNVTVTLCVFTSPRPFYIFFFKGVGPPKNIGISAYSTLHSLYTTLIHFLSLGKLHLLCESGRRARGWRRLIPSRSTHPNPLHVNGDRVWKEFHSLVRRAIGYLRRKLLKLFHSISDESSRNFLFCRPLSHHPLSRKDLLPLPLPISKHLWCEANRAKGFEKCVPRERLNTLRLDLSVRNYIKFQFRPKNVHKMFKNINNCWNISVQVFAMNLYICSGYN